MPSRPRSEVFDPDSVGIYHCYNKVAQGLFLLGVERRWGRDFGHRKIWLRRTLQTLARAMALEVLDYAVLDNHFHVILRNRPDLVATWSNDEVVIRWDWICPELRDAQGNRVEPEAWQVRLWAQNKSRVRKLRKRLSDISWFMRLYQQRIARRANAEQETTGSHFWAVGSRPNELRTKQVSWPAPCMST